MLDAVWIEVHERGLCDTVSNSLPWNYGLSTFSHDTFQDASKKLSGTINAQMEALSQGVFKESANYEKSRRIDNNKK